MEAIDTPLGFAVSLAVVAMAMALVGIPVLKSLTLTIEGLREFHGDSLTRRQKTRGWLGAVIWALVAMVIWTFFVDWFRAGNIAYAQHAFAWRGEKLLQALARQ